MKTPSALKKWNVKRKIERERNAFIRDHDPGMALMTKTEELLWKSIFEKNTLDRTLGRMNTHIGNHVGQCIQAHPDWTVGELCRLVFQEYPDEVRTGMGNLLPESVHRVIRTAAENILVAELVTRKKIAYLLDFI